MALKVCVNLGIVSAKQMCSGLPRFLEKNKARSRQMWSIQSLHANKNEWLLVRVWYAYSDSILFSPCKVLFSGRSGRMRMRMLFSVTSIKTGSEKQKYVKHSWIASKETLIQQMLSIFLFHCLLPVHRSWQLTRSTLTQDQAVPKQHPAFSFRSTIWLYLNLMSFWQAFDSYCHILGYLVYFLAWEWEWKHFAHCHKLCSPVCNMERNLRWAPLLW